MKKILALIMFASLAFSLSACGEATENDKETIVATETSITVEETTIVETTSQPETTAKVGAVEVEFLPEEVPTKFIFASGAGAWGCVLNLSHDGSFEGSYHNSEMGINSEEYPNGTVCDCVFSGKFENIVKVNDYTYSMTLAEINTERIVGEEWIENGVRYVASEPLGISGGEEFILYWPETPISELSDEFLRWWPYRRGENIHDTLSCYGILNVNEQIGFFCKE